MLHERQLGVVLRHSQPAEDWYQEQLNPCLRSRGQPAVLQPLASPHGESGALGTPKLRPASTDIHGKLGDVHVAPLSCRWLLHDLLLPLRLTPQRRLWEVCHHAMIVARASAASRHGRMLPTERAPAGLPRIPATLYVTNIRHATSHRVTDILRSPPSSWHPSGLRQVRAAFARPAVLSGRVTCTADAVGQPAETDVIYKSRYINMLVGPTRQSG